MKKYLFWDFDGVLFNSIDECLISSYNAYQSYKHNSNALVSSLDDIPEGLRSFYYHHRKFVRPAGEYFIIHHAYDNQLTLENYDVFAQLIKDCGAIIPEFQRLVFKKRGDLKEADLNTWLALHQPYHNIVNVWTSLDEKYINYVVSNKDKGSILSLLGDFQMNIDPEKVYGGDFSSNKLEIINYLLKSFDINADEVIFIDDNYHHLYDVMKTGIQLMFADWGYGDPPDQIDMSIKKLSLSSLPQALENQ
jgi:phosphoglycolate phosphatase-like HAD superfamily hydrolase